MSVNKSSSATSGDTVKTFRVEIEVIDKTSSFLFWSQN